MTVIDRIPEERRWKWTGEAAERAVAAGILPEDGRWEIVDGQLVNKMPQGDLHTSFVNFLLEALREVFPPSEAHFQANAPVLLDVGEEPEPDVTIIRGRARERIGRKAGPADTLLVIEVSVSSGSENLGWKLRKYAAFGVPEYWIFDLRKRTLDVFTEPLGSRYDRRTTYRSDASLPLISGTLDEILGDARP